MSKKIIKKNKKKGLVVRGDFILGSNITVNKDENHESNPEDIEKIKNLLADDESVEIGGDLIIRNNGNNDEFTTPTKEDIEMSKLIQEMGEDIIKNTKIYCGGDFVIGSNIRIIKK